MKYAQIKDGLVKNIIIVDDEVPLDTFKEGFDEIVKLDKPNLDPDIGFKYDGKDFVKVDSVFPQDDDIVEASPNGQGPI